MSWCPPEGEGHANLVGYHIKLRFKIHHYNQNDQSQNDIMIKFMMIMIIVIMTRSRLGGEVLRSEFVAKMRPRSLVGHDDHDDDHADHDDHTDDDHQADRRKTFEAFFVKSEISGQPNRAFSDTLVQKSCHF